MFNFVITGIHRATVTPAGRVPAGHFVVQKNVDTRAKFKHG